MEKGKCVKCGSEVAYDCITDDGLAKVGEDHIVYYWVECIECEYKAKEKYKLMYLGTEK